MGRIIRLAKSSIEVATTALSDKIVLGVDLRGGQPPITMPICHQWTVSLGSNPIFLCISMYFYVLSLFIISMYYLYVLSLCIISMYYLYVLSLCIISMYYLYVYLLFAPYLYIL